LGAAFDLVVQVKRLSDGRRRVVSISEVTGVQEGVISMQDIFEFKQTGSQEDGSFGGHHRSCGIRPAKANRFAEQGIELPVELFKEDAI
jgi:pilus assembly protein CpaF